MKNHKRLLSGALAAALALSQVAYAKTPTAENDKLKSKAKGEWITISGKVTSVSPDKFTLKPKGKPITVEMDDFDLAAEGYMLKAGDQVIVNGRADKNFFSKDTIEASSVYVKNLDAYFYANAADEENAPIIATTYFGAAPLPEGATADLRGIVTSITGDEFTLDTGLRRIKVDTEKMPLNPLDKKGLVQVNVGDYVRVSGRVDNSFLEGKEIEARYIVDFS